MTIPEIRQMTDERLDEETERRLMDAKTFGVTYGLNHPITLEADAGLRSRIRELVEEARRETEARADESFMRVISDV